MSTIAIFDDLDTTLSPAAPQKERVDPRSLYNRWESRHWQVAELDYAADRVVWNGLHPLYHSSLLRSLAEIEVGEVSVTATLSSLIEHAETEDDQIYLATQIADEARHVVFFQTYLQQVAGIDLATEGTQLRARTDYGQYFDGELRRVTKLIHTEGDTRRQSWCTASVYYHLITEGVLATTGLRTTRQLAREIGLPTLDIGLTNVTRDESRHVNFGMMAARRAVASGLADTLIAAYMKAVELAAVVLVGPHTRQHVPIFRTALLHRAAELQGPWSTARDRVARQLPGIGLSHCVPEATTVFDKSIEAALDTYAEIWDKPHPVRLATA